MKKNILLFIVIISICFLTACNGNSDSKKFANEYNQVTEYNVFVYKNINEITKILEHGTGVIYLGFPECPWCQAYVPKLNEVADTEGLEKIYYYNILEIRKNNTKEYQKLVNILSDYLQYDDEGNKRIYVPAVIVVSKGKIIGFDDESSYDTLGFDDPAEYWNDERTNNLKLRLSEMIDQVVDNSCTDCNK